MERENPIPYEEFERIARLKGGVTHVIKGFCEETQAIWLIKHESVYFMEILIRYLKKEDRLRLEERLHNYSVDYNLWTQNHGYEEKREMELTIKLRTAKQLKGIS